MLVLKPLFILGVFLLKMVYSEFQCCKQVLANGSVAYTLNDTVPETCTSIWTRNGTVIVGIDKDIDPAHVVSQTENGCILRKSNSAEIVCRLECPSHGVSEEIYCTDQCNPSARTADNSTDNSTGNVIFPLFITLGLISIFGVFGTLFIYKWYKRSYSHDNRSDVEMPLNVQNQNQDQNHDQDQNQDQNHDQDQNQDQNQDQDQDQNQDQNQDQEDLDHQTLY